MIIYVSDNRTYGPLILTSKGRGGSPQEVLPIIDLTFASMSNLLRCGTPLCGKVATKNKDKFAYDLFLLLGLFALSNVAFCNGGFLNGIGFVAKPIKCKNDSKLLKSTSHITLVKSRHQNRQPTYMFL
jgi:hypothetical protein